MSRIEKLNKLDLAIKDAELRLKSIQDAIDKADIEVNILTILKNELDQNIKFHKKSGTIPLAHEYRKSKAELVKVKNTLVSINSDRKNAIEACKQIELIMKKFQKDRADLLKIDENNVLRVLFGVKRGKR